MTKRLRFSPVVKDRLFYNKFQYCIGFYLAEVSCLKNLDHDYIDMILTRRVEWRDLHRQRQKSAGGKFPTINTRLAWRDEITETTKQDLHHLTDRLLNSPDEFKLVTSVNRAWVYTNSLNLLTELDQNSALKNKFFTQAIINRPADTIKLKKSPYQQRSYFKVIKMTAQQKDTLQQFFVSQQDQIRLSPALKNWFDDAYHRTQDYFFVDHRDNGWLVMLALVHGGLIRKTLTIVQG